MEIGIAMVSSIMAAIGLFFTGYQVKRLSAAQRLANYQKMVEGESVLWRDIRQNTSLVDSYISALGIDRNKLQVDDDQIAGVCSILGYFENIYYQISNSTIPKELAPGWETYMNRVLREIDVLPQIWKGISLFYWSSFSEFVDESLKQK